MVIPNSGNTAISVSRDELMQIPVPQATKSYFPIAHHRVLGLTEQAVQRAGFTIEEADLRVTHAGARFFGMLTVNSNGIHTETRRFVACRSSFDRRIPVGIAAGLKVLCCSNLCMSGDVVQVSRKHTRFMASQIAGLIQNAVWLLRESFIKQDERISAYKACRLTNAQANDLIVRAMEAGVIPSSHIKPVVEEWRNPSHQEFRDEYSAWRLQNAITEQLKAELLNLPWKSQSLYRLLDPVAGIAA